MEEEEPELQVDFEVGDTPSIEEELLACDPLNNEERAIVLFKPMNNAGLVHSPSSFSVSSDIISGFKSKY